MHTYTMLRDPEAWTHHPFKELSNTIEENRWWGPPKMTLISKFLTLQWSLRFSKIYWKYYKG
jgi:hypothetical protein